MNRHARMGGYEIGQGGENLLSKSKGKKMRSEQKQTGAINLSAPLEENAAVKALEAELALLYKKLEAYNLFNGDRDNMTVEWRARQMLPQGEEMIADNDERGRVVERVQRIGDEIVSAYRAAERQRRSDVDAFVKSKAYHSQCVLVAGTAAAFARAVCGLLELERSVSLPKSESALPAIGEFNLREPTSTISELLAQAVDRGLVNAEALPVELEQARAAS